MAVRHPVEAAVRAALVKHHIVALPPRAPYTREGLRIKGSLAGNARCYADQGGREGQKRLMDRVEAALVAEGIAVKRLDDQTVNALSTPRPAPR